MKAHVLNVQVHDPVPGIFPRKFIPREMFKEPYRGLTVLINSNLDAVSIVRIPYETVVILEIPGRVLV